MFDTIKGVIGDIAAGAIKDQRIALSQEQLAALEIKLRDALAENTRLSNRVAELERLEAGRNQLLPDPKSSSPPGEVCPYCQQSTGRLKNLKPHSQALMAHVGIKIGYYECSNLDCGKSFDKQVKT